MWVMRFEAAIMNTSRTTRQPIHGQSLLTFCSAVMALVGPAPASRGSEIYRSVDSKGQVIYADKPVTPSAVRVSVQAPPGISEADRARIAAEQEATAKAEAERALKTEAERQAIATQEQARQAGLEICRRARDRYLMFKESGRIYRRDEHGRRVFYTSAEIDTERAAARKAMDDLCR